MIGSITNNWYLPTDILLISFSWYPPFGIILVSFRQIILVSLGWYPFNDIYPISFWYPLVDILLVSTIWYSFDVLPLLSFSWYLPVDMVFSTWYPLDIPSVDIFLVSCWHPPVFMFLIWFSRYILDILQLIFSWYLSVDIFIDVLQWIS